MFDPEGQFKHDAWATLGAIGAEEAKMKYVDLLVREDIAGMILFEDVYV